jgi:hypothetical protein
MTVTAEDLEHLPYNDANLGRIFTKDCKENIKLFIRDFRAGSVGGQIKEAGLDTGENLDAILEDAQTQTGHEDVNLKEYEASARRMWLIGDLKPKQKQAEEPPAPKPLTASQQAWSEYRIFSESHTSSECKARARVDAGYASFMRKNYEREMGETQVGDAVVAIGTQAVRQDKTRVTQDLREFAQAYRLAPTSEVKRLMSTATNPSFADYRAKLDAAIACGLL